MAKLVIGTPCYNGTVTMQYMSSMLRLQPILAQEGIAFSLAMTASESLITRARNFIVSQFLDGPQYTHLLFIDADIGFDPCVVSRYLKADKDIVAGIYPIKHLDPEAIRGLPFGRSIATTLNYATKLCKTELPNADGFLKAEYATTGFMLIKRTVLEQMAAAHPELKYERSFSKGGRGTNLYALFDTSLDREKGLYLPEDYTFCNRWRAMGGEIWVDVRSKFTHVGTFEYHGDFAALINQEDCAVD
jgi:hypothetical protein